MCKIVKIQKNAAISRAESEKEIAKAQANARREAMYFKALPKECWNTIK